MQTKPITDPTDPRRQMPAQTLDRAQAILWATHKMFSPDTLAAKALRLAYETARVAYYAVIEETDGDHLEDVKLALQQVEEHINPPKKRTPEEIQQRIDDNFFEEEYD